jgi:hypothetical protein
MTLQLLHSEFSYRRGKFDFLFYQCTMYCCSNVRYRQTERKKSCSCKGAGSYFCPYWLRRGGGNSVMKVNVTAYHVCSTHSQQCRHKLSLIDIVILYTVSSTASQITETNPELLQRRHWLALGSQTL